MNPIKWIIEVFFFLIFNVLGVLAQDGLFSMDQALDLTVSVPDGVTIEKGEKGTDYRIQSKGNDPVFIPICEIPVGMEDCQLSYTARMSSEEGTQKAYLEMWCVVNGNSYFSKALDQSFIGRSGWKDVSTPFFLKKGEIAEKAVLGVRFEGPGTVGIDRIALFRLENAFWGDVKQNWQWIPGTLFGVFVGLYGGIVGFFAPRGRAKSLVFGLGIFFECLATILLFAGMILWLLGQPFNNWYGLLLPGIIGLAVMTPLFFSINKIYAEADNRKMQARDLAL